MRNTTENELCWNGCIEDGRWIGRCLKPRRHEGPCHYEPTVKITAGPRDYAPIEVGSGNPASPSHSDSTRRSEAKAASSQPEHSSLEGRITPSVERIASELHSVIIGSDFGLIEKLILAARAEAQGRIDQEKESATARREDK